MAVDSYDKVQGKEKINGMIDRMRLLDDLLMTMVFDRRFEEYDEWFDDGNHIIYANAAYSDESTDIGKLMHDFREQDPDRMYFPELRDGVSHFKKAERGRDRMGGEVEEYTEEYSKKRSENAAINSAIKTCRDLNPEMTDSQIKEYIMRSFGLSEETAGKYFTPQPA